MDQSCAALADRKAIVDQHGHFTGTIPSSELQQEVSARWESLMSQIQELPVPSPKYDALKGHFVDYMRNVKREIGGMLSDPFAPYLQLQMGVDFMVRKSCLSELERKEEICRLLSALSPMWEACRDWMYRCSDDRKSTAVRRFLNFQETLEYYAGNPEVILPGLVSSEKKALTAALKQGSKALEGFLQDLKSHTEVFTTADNDDDSKVVKLDYEEYKKILELRYGVDLDEIISWGDSEINKTRSECMFIAERLAKQYNEPVPENMNQVNDLLLKYAGPADTPQEMLERGRYYLKRARALAHEYVKLPEDETCSLVTPPYRLRITYPWGGYEGGDTNANPIHGQMFLNVWNHTNVTDGWMKINALHEAYPGHHVQYVRRITDPMPDTIRRGAKNIAIMEGMCIRTEKTFEFGFGEDPFYPLFTAYRRHHASVRIVVDLMLFYQGKTIGEAVKTYMDELGFDRTSARGQILAQEDSPGYFTCYYYGLKKIWEWEAQYGYNKKDYTELLFSVGNISLSTFEKILKMEPAERESYLQDFGTPMIG